MRLLKRILLAIAALIFTLAGLIAGHFILDRQDDYPVDLSGVEVPGYTGSTIAFQQGNDFSVSLPFMASAVIDVDGDGVEELFLGGGRDSPDGLFEFENGHLVAIEGARGLTKGHVASYGSVVLDVDGDRRQDLLVAREDGIWLHRNVKGRFTATKLNAVMPEGTVPLSIAVADLNRDGRFDMYVAGYIRPDLVEGQTTFREGYGGSSRLFLNRGDDTFIDITEPSGLAYQHNTFQAAFLDIDRDGKEDLVVAHDTGHVLTWRNKGDLEFERIANPTSDNYSYPMGIGVTDLDDDGLADLFFSNVGSTLPDFMVRGDLSDAQTSNWKWTLFHNRGGFRFEDAAGQRRIADYEFSWGGVFEDLNLDGREDLIVSENYIGLPTYQLPFLRANGRLLLQKPNGEFVAAEKAAQVINRAFSISPLTADFNGDGRPDIVHANLNGDSRLFLSKPGNGNYLKVKLPDTARSIAATVTVRLSDGRTLSRPFVSGEGLCSDSSHTIIFGLGDVSALEVNVSYLAQAGDRKTGNFRNQMLKF